MLDSEALHAALQTYNPGSLFLRSISWERRCNVNGKWHFDVQGKCVKKPEAAVVMSDGSVQQIELYDTAHWPLFIELTLEDES